MSKSTITLTVNSGPKQGESLTRNSKSTVRIGRVVKGNTLAIKDTSISQKHLTIQFDLQTAQWVLTDLGSANGTIVNGVKVSNESIKVSDGDAIRIGESTEIHVRVLIEEMKIGAKRGRNLKKDEISEPNLEASENLKSALKKDDTSAGLCILDESAEVDGGCESGSVYEPKHAAKSKKKNVSRVLRSVVKRNSIVKEKKSNGKRESIVKKVKVLESSLDYIEDKEVNNVEKPRDQNVEVASHTLNFTTDDGLQKNLGRGRKRNSAKALKNDTTIEVPKSLTKGRKQMCTRGSKKDLNMESSVMDASENILSADELNASYSGNKGVTEAKTKVSQNLTRGRTRKSNMIVESSHSEKIESSINGKKISDIRNKPIREDKIVAVTVKRGRRGKNNNISITENAVEENAVVSKNVRRGRSSKCTKGLNEELSFNMVIKDKVESSVNDIVLEDKAKAQKTNRGGKRTTKSAKVIEENETHNLAPDEDKVAVPEVVKRGRRNKTSMISKIDDKLETIVENRTTSSELSNFNDIGEIKPRTRASSRVLKAQVKSMDPVIAPKENSYVLENQTENKMWKAEDEINHVVLPQKENAGKNHESNPKVWVGNGIPNSTTKYKEDQMIKWHGTPFEERVERALSDERFFPQRNTS